MLFHLHGDGATLPPSLTPASRSLLHQGGNYSRAAQRPLAGGLTFIQSERKETTRSAESKPGSKRRKYRHTDIGVCAYVVYFLDCLHCCPGGHCHHFQIPIAHQMRHCPSSKVHLACDVARLQRCPPFQDMIGGLQGKRGFAV